MDKEKKKTLTEALMIIIGTCVVTASGYLIIINLIGLPK